ncbi:BnaA01g08240D [Brassica napus]|uniref:BnaA01g08240D protein n=1 Tax=Brassica napus TaxID=3708 RepID=A0A078HBT0_BRANA|nr:BnaA01g08240D [Brassica napus]
MRKRNLRKSNISLLRTEGVHKTYVACLVVLYYLIPQTRPLNHASYKFSIITYTLILSQKKKNINNQSYNSCQIPFKMEYGNSTENGIGKSNGIGNGHGIGNGYVNGHGICNGHGNGHGIGNGHGNDNGYVNGNGKVNGEKMKKMKPMDSEMLREQGHIMVDFIADYYKNLEDSPQDFPVLSQVQPGYLRDILPDSAPDHPEPLKELLHDVSKKIIPGLTHWQSPSYFAYYASSTSVAGFLGEMLNAGLSVVGFTWLTSPAATELEVIVLDWLAKLLQLPDHFLSTGRGGGVIQGTGCEAVLVVVLAARDRIMKKAGKNSLSQLVVYASDQTHSSFRKACLIGGIHEENIRLLKTDSSTNYGMPPKSLEEAISSDLAKGFIPFFICATVGTTSSAAVDPLVPLGKIAKSYGIWMHVDAAYAGNACICPEFRKHIDGVENADSFNINAHKWLFANQTCSPLWVKDRYSLIDALKTNPEYLEYKVSKRDEVVNYKDWQISLSRRFRSLKLWMVLRLYGAENLRNFIRDHVNLAKHFEDYVAQDAHFEVVTTRYFSLVCFRLAPVDGDEDKCNERNRELLATVNSTGKIFISHTALSGKFILRFAVGAPLTEEKHVTEAWRIIQKHATKFIHNKKI